MAVAGKTSEAVLVVGGNSWAQDLSDYANGVDVPGTLNTERLTVLESDGVETVALSSSLQIAIGTMYYGAGPKVVAAHQADVADSYVALLVPNVGCYFGAAIWDSLPFDNPTGGVVSHAATFRAGDAWSWGEGVAVAKPFVLNATTSSVNIGSVPANAKLLLIDHKLNGVLEELAELLHLLVGGVQRAAKAGHEVNGRPEGRHPISYEEVNDLPQRWQQDHKTLKGYP